MVRPTFLGIETALRGIQTNQKSLDIVGQNLTNVSTPGYTRQRTDQISVTLAGGGRYDVIHNTSLMGQGVEINGVNQIRDPFLDKRFREEYATVAYYDQSAVILEDVESALNELGNTGLKNAMEDMISSLKTFSTKPDDVTNASIVMNSMVQFTQVLNLFDQKLTEVSDQQKFDTEVAVDDVNSILERIAKLNGSIKDTMMMNSVVGDNVYGPNELFDERNVLLDQLAYYGDINVDEVEFGVVNVTMGGHTVIEDETYETLGFSVLPEGPISLNWQKDGSTFVSEGGALMAYTDMINGAGPHVSHDLHNFEKGIPYYQEKLDQLASGFAHAFNNVVPLEAGGYKTLFDPTSGSVTAENLTVTSDWLTNPEYIMQGVDKNGELDNTYIISMISQFEVEHAFAEFEGSFEGYVNFINTTVGQQVTFNTSRLTATTAVADDMLNRRDSVSAVSDSEEAADLMMYERAYQAVARLMTTLDEALNTIINGMGVVGR